MAEDTELLREIRDLLRLLAEPALAKRDQRLRTSLQEIVGKSKRKTEAVLLMDGTRPRALIQTACGMDSGNLSRLVKALRSAGLLEEDNGQPRLIFPLPSDFADAMRED